MTAMLGFSFRLLYPAYLLATVPRLAEDKHLSCQKKTSIKSMIYQINVFLCRLHFRRVAISVGFSALVCRPAAFSLPADYQGNKYWQINHLPLNRPKTHRLSQSIVFFQQLGVFRERGQRVAGCSQRIGEIKVASQRTD
jgi:hypothetical protein